jgi:excisionase family DNA binding protein
MSTVEKVERGMLTVDEAAWELGLKASTIRAWLLRRKNISFVKVGRCVRIPRSEVERLIRENTVRAREVR